MEKKHWNRWIIGFKEHFLKEKTVKTVNLSFAKFQWTAISKRGNR